MHNLSDNAKRERSAGNLFQQLAPKYRPTPQITQQNARVYSAAEIKRWTARDLRWCNDGCHATLRGQRTMLAILFALVLEGCANQTDPWLVPAEARIQERYDVECAKERLARFKGRTAEGWIVIDGTSHPHLFFPVELMSRFLVATAPARSARVREIYRDEIEGNGWDYEFFWKTVDDASHQFHSRWDSVADDQRRTRGKVPPDDPRRAAICRERAAVLKRLRATFGPEAFDRFLYTALARGTIMAFDPEATNAQTLLRNEAGCP